jgi:histidinol-phosphate/aromatic aminotransferase/cobyric acid decarboxylase-like protein
MRRKLLQSLVASHPNLLVVHTMSKSQSLVGLRVGYAIGDAALIEALTAAPGKFSLARKRIYQATLGNTFSELSVTRA